MNKGKKLLKWGLLVLGCLIYVGIGAIPFCNGVENKDGKGLLKILTVGEMVVLGLMLVALIVAIVLIVKFKKKLGTVVREYESEVKRITWLSWSETKKSTVIVLIGMIVCGAVISLLDLGLAEGILAFLGLF